MEVRTGPGGANCSVVRVHETSWQMADSGVRMSSGSKRTLKYMFVFGVVHRTLLTYALLSCI
eukprot:8336446-Lingulodinium_polyedra.AAC.1